MAKRPDGDTAEPIEAGDEVANALPLFEWDGGRYTTTPVPFSPHGDPAQVVVPRRFQERKEGFRSAWVATVFNLNFAPTNGPERFVEQYRAVLDTFASYNMNAVLFQIRPEQDAWYPSALGNSWSKYLTPSRVQGTDPGFDPLEIMVQMTHEAGMEYHAWFNPYRVASTKTSMLSQADAASVRAVGYTMEELSASDAQKQIKIYREAGLLVPGNFAAEHPEWVLKHDQKLFLNPGVQEVQCHIVATIAEVCRNYRVDAVHFDDYFYPRGFASANTDPLTASDGAQFAENGEGFPHTPQGLDDWRRSNTDALVHAVHSEISAHNAREGSSVQFGISPAAIWNSVADDPKGSHTPAGSDSSYLDLYCDTYKWIKNEWLDYVIPQLYSSFAQESSPYATLARWWNAVAKGTRVQVYVGQAMYRVGTEMPEWSNPEEIPNQIRFNQTLSSVAGESFYSYGEIVRSEDNPVLAKTQEIVKEYWDCVSLVPAKIWLSHGVASPTHAVCDGSVLRWKSGDPATTQFFVVYKGEGAPDDICRDPRNIVGRVYADGKRDFAIPVTAFRGTDDASCLKYIVTAVNAAGVESEPCHAQ